MSKAGRMTGRVTVRLKSGVLDAEGTAIAKALGSLGFGDVRGVRVGRVFEVELEVADLEVARARLEQMAEKLLANPVMETFTLEVE